MGKRKPQVFETAFAIYRAVCTVGEGGSGTVYKVEDETGAPYALKCLDPTKITQQKLKRFKNELSFCHSTMHPNIIKVLDWGKTVRAACNCPFYVMPYYQTTLRARIREGIPHQTALQYYCWMTNGVEAAHLQGIWHRDLKPENILIDPSSDALVIADFGIAHFSQDELYTAVETCDQERLGNFQYSAPEQRARGGLVDHRADIFALGLMLNEMFTGVVPHGTGYRRISQVADEYAYLDDLVDQMLSQKPEGRPDSIDVIKQQLIARRNQFVTRQKLSELKKIVIPAQAIDDPLVLDPIAVAGLDYKEGRLILLLSQKPNKAWIETFGKAPVRYYRTGEQPSAFYFNENRALVSIANQPDHFAKKLVNRFKEYVAQTNNAYAAAVRKQLQRQEEMERQRLRQEIQEHERRQRILKDVKI